MTIPRWVDRIWLVLIAIAFLIGAPIWVILMVERLGWQAALGGIALALFVRYRRRERCC